MRPIDADYLITVLKADGIWGRYFGLAEKIDEAPTVTHPQPAWISTTDRLPEPGDIKYLVCCRTAKGLRSINMAWFDGAFWHGMGSMSGVTHWMPLPDLPEVGA